MDLAHRIAQDLEAVAKEGFNSNNDHFNIARACEIYGCSDIQLLCGLAEAIEILRNEKNPENGPLNIWDPVVEIDEIPFVKGRVRNFRTGENVTGITPRCIQCGEILDADLVCPNHGELSNG